MSMLLVIGGSLLSAAGVGIAAYLVQERRQSGRRKASANFYKKRKGRSAKADD
jgi:hypothetical protein